MDYNIPGLQTITEVAFRARNAARLRKELDLSVAFRNPKLGETIRQSRDMLDQEIATEVESLEGVPLWKDHIWPAISGELGLTTCCKPIQKVNILRTLYVLFNVLKEEDRKVNGPISTSAEECIAVLTSLSGNQYFTFEGIQESILCAYPLWDGNKNPRKIQACLNRLVSERKAVRKLMVGGKETYKKRTRRDK